MDRATLREETETLLIYDRRTLRCIPRPLRRMGTGADGDAGMANVPTVLMSGTGLVAMEKFGGTTRVVGVPE